MQYEPIPEICFLCHQEALKSNTYVFRPCYCRNYVHATCLANHINFNGHICRLCSEEYSIPTRLRKSKITWFDDYILQNIAYLYSSSMFVLGWIPLSIIATYAIYHVLNSNLYSLYYFVIILTCIDLLGFLKDTFFCSTNLFYNNQRRYVIQRSVCDFFTKCILSISFWLFYNITYTAFLHVICISEYQHWNTVFANIAILYVYKYTRAYIKQCTETSWDHRVANAFNSTYYNPLNFIMDYGTEHFKN